VNQKVSKKKKRAQLARLLLMENSFVVKNEPA